jgi:methionyl-tRNA formyltransferase
MKLIFMGTPELAVPSLARLIRDGHQISAVFTQPDKPAGRGKHLHTSPVKSLALEHGIQVHQPARIKTDEETRKVFESIAPDACVVAAYGKILPPWMLAIPRLGCINVHASLLPRYRGAAPINWAIANGDTETGVTIMQMDVGMDTGPMLASRAIQIGKDETTPELSARLAELGASLLSETLEAVERGEIEAVPQDNARATLAPMLKREDGLIDWTMNAKQISDRVRGFQPWPASYTFFRGSRLMLWRATAVRQNDIGVGRPGEIVSLDRLGFAVSCGENTGLHIEELQIEGKRRMNARDFVNGAHISTGQRINEAAEQR